MGCLDAAGGKVLRAPLRRRVNARALRTSNVGMFWPRLPLPDCRHSAPGPLSNLARGAVAVDQHEPCSRPTNATRSEPAPESDDGAVKGTTLHRASTPRPETIAR